MAKNKPTRWQRLLAAHRTYPWMTSLAQAHMIGSVTISKVRSEARAHGYKWVTRKSVNGWIEYQPVKVRK